MTEESSVLGLDEISVPLTLVLAALPLNEAPISEGRFHTLKE